MSVSTVSVRESSRLVSVGFGVGDGVVTVFEEEVSTDLQDVSQEVPVVVPEEAPVVVQEEVPVAEQEEAPAIMSEEVLAAVPGEAPIIVPEEALVSVLGGSLLLA